MPASNNDSALAWHDLASSLLAVQAGQEALDAVDAFFETTWGAQSPPASQPMDESPALQPVMLPGSVPLALAHHLSRPGSQDAHAMAAHAAMGSYALAAAQNGGAPALNGAPGPGQRLHTQSALHSRRNSSDGECSRACKTMSICAAPCSSVRVHRSHMSGSAVVTCGCKLPGPIFHVSIIAHGDDRLA